MTGATIQSFWGDMADIIIHGVETDEFVIMPNHINGMSLFW